MFNLRKGCEITHPEKLKEEYIVLGDRIKANVSSENIIPLLINFTQLQKKEEMFFYMETPAVAEDSLEMVEGYKDVYYIDNISALTAESIIREAGNILVNDGTATFGFGVYKTDDEIGVGQYNDVQILSDKPGKYRKLFTAMGICETSKLVSAWDTFKEGDSGSCSVVVTDDLTIYDLPAELESFGMYFDSQVKI